MVIRRPREDLVKGVAIHVAKSLTNHDSNPSLSAMQSELQRKSRLYFPRNARIMPVFPRFFLSKPDAENGLLSCEGGFFPSISLDGTGAVRFQGGH
jgi:hypothetical protein